MHFLMYYRAPCTSKALGAGPKRPVKEYAPPLGREKVRQPPEEAARFGVGRSRGIRILTGMFMKGYSSAYVKRRPFIHSLTHESRSAVSVRTEKSQAAR